VSLDYLRFYDLETFLFEDVHRRFHAEGSLGALDFFAIVIWKANRAKSNVAKRLLKRGDLETVVRDLTRSLHDAPDDKSRLRILLQDWGFYLPMATGILSVLWPDEFSVYDVRVCGQLHGFQSLGNKSDFDAIWEGYGEYLAAVRAATPDGLSLRDKDRFLFGKSVAEQLASDLGRGFQRIDNTERFTDWSPETIRIEPPRSSPR
jgi:hypothetical protein